jgi:alpha-mannosidase
MYTPLEFDRARFTSFSRTILQPAIYGDSQSLAVSAMQCANPIPYAEASERPHEAVEVGWRWGPAWTTAWFHVTGAVPETMRGACVALRFSSGTEAMVWRNGEPTRGLDRFRDLVVLLDSANGGEAIDLRVEAACNHPFGITSFAWDPPETQDRWNSDKPGELQRCELAVYHYDVWRLHTAVEFVLQLLEQLPEESTRAQELGRGLQRTMQAVDAGDVPGSAGRALEVLRGVIDGTGEHAASECYAVGHAHIDTAWLWPLRETKRKCLRSFSNVLELMDRYDDFIFLCSQAQQYAYVEEQSPALFERIAERVRDGRWEPGGAMWIEPDCNVPSGESLARQILHGTRYWREKFGERGNQRHVYLPDTFGFPAVLPQLMVKAGLDTFITNKLSWNQFNDWPDVNFIWRGLDGSEVLAHCTPGHDYNTSHTPLELVRGEKNNARKDRAALNAWLQPFGYGDGGGGPTAEMIERAQLAKACEGLPKVRMSRADDFCELLHERRRAREAEGDKLQVWDGELYLELHRGTLTTQSWIKKANRRAETSLRLLELLAFAGPTPMEAKKWDQLRGELDEIWKLVLLNQFHDILPGSSIAMVYEDAREDHARIADFCEKQIEEAVDAWAESADTREVAKPALVVNPSSHSRRGVIDVEGELHFVEDLAPAGASVVDIDKPGEVAPVKIEGQVLSNGILEATIDEAGQVAGLYCCCMGRDVRPSSAPPLNELVLYEDVPHSWDAWEIDPQYSEKAFPVIGKADAWRVVEEHPLRCAIEVKRKLGRASHITQRFVLEAGSPRLDIVTTVDWQEEHRLLRVNFPVDVRASHVNYGTQFGHIERPAHRNTPWDRARFEVCAHGWMSIGEPGFGLAVLDDCKYGHSCDGNVLGLTLLRSPTHPDPKADIGMHEFTYSLMPHAGDWRGAGVDLEAEMLNNPLVARAIAPARAGNWSKKFTPVEVEFDGAGRVNIEAIKPAEDGVGLVIRLVELQGARGEVRLLWNLPVTDVAAVNLLEEPTELLSLVHNKENRRTTLQIKPFEIITLAVKLA